MPAEHTPSAATGQAAGSVGDLPTLAGERPAVAATLDAAPPGYLLDRELGRGGMGVVYLATQAGLNREVALKMILSGDHAHPRERARFLAEAEAVAAVRHPNVVQVHELGEHHGRPFLALEYCPGGTLADRLDGQPLSPAEAARLLAKLADAVQAVHDVGTVHRDLKPGNILLDAAGEPKVTDFGLAKRDTAADLTRTGAVLGTPAYMAPEQAGGAKFVGPAADVWALGVILFECLTGRRPFAGDDAVSLLLKVVGEPAPPPSDVVPGLTRDLDLIVGKCLAKAPADRYPSAAALAADLRAFAAGKPVSVRPPTLANVLRGWASQNVGRIGWVLPLGLGIGLVTGFFFWVTQISPGMDWFGRGYEHLPSEARPWPLALAVPLPGWAKRVVGLGVLVAAGGVGLWTALAVRTKSRDADLAAGLVVGLVAAMSSFVLGVGPYLTVLATLRDAPRDLELLGYAAWSDLPRGEQPAVQMLLDAYPDLRARGFDARADAVRRKVPADIVAGAVSGLWVGAAVCLLLFVPFGIYATAVAGRLVRAGVGWRAVLAGYFERAAPVIMLIGLPVTNLGAITVTGGRGVKLDRFWLQSATELTPLALAVVAVHRGWWWPLRLALHAAWLFAVIYW